MKISEEVIERIKQENDIVDIISESVRLKRSGRNFFGLCPFHNDKNPSFSVSQEKQIYKCFSCGEAGNVVTFVMKQKNLQYVEALKYLAEKANIPLDLKEGRVDSSVNRKKDILYKVNVETGRFFFKNLTENNVAKEYFSNRGIKNSTIRKFGLGYAKDEWSSLIYYLRKKGFKEETLLEAGLVSKSPKGKVYDRFRNRVMFPVFNIKGNVIGFGGRVLDDSKPKYLNSPETLVFQKGYNLYGLNFAIKDLEDEEILSAIRWHTTGKENMTKLEKIIYIADMIEPSRDFDGVEELRKVTLENLNKGVLMGLTQTIKFLLKKGSLIDLNTIKARNSLIN